MILNKLTGYVRSHANKQYLKLLVISHAVLFIGLLFSSTVFSKSVVIVKEKSVSIQNQIASRIRENLEKSSPAFQINTQNLEDITREQVIQTSPDLIVTLGSKAAKKFSASSATLLHTLITESFVNEQIHCILRDCKPAQNTYAIHLDQPVNRQLNLITLLLPDKQFIGILKASFSAHQASKLESHIKKQGGRYFSEYIDDESQLNSKLKKLLEKTDVFIALPDPLIHNRRTIPHLLLTTYRYGTPLIGFSKAYVNAGAIAAVYSSPEQISKQIAELTVKILSKYPPKPGSYPSKYFEIAINKSVSRSFGLSFPDENSIKAELLKLEQ